MATIYSRGRGEIRKCPNDNTADACDVTGEDPKILFDFLLSLTLEELSEKFFSTG